MECRLCEKPIKGYTQVFNHIRIDETHEADLCQECIDSIMKWQGRIYSDLFPTKAMKKRYGKKED